MERQQDECEHERWDAAMRALNDAKIHGVSDETLQTLCFECGIPYRYFEERKSA